MTPEAFVAKWSEATTKERAASQEHFIDLCRVLGEKTPHEADPAGEWYAFEKGVEKTGAGRGWADVWKKGCFGWEYKSKSGGRASTMSGALKQLQLYALALESPPLLIVSDIDTIEIHTAFQNAVQEVHFIRLEELVDPDKLKLLRWAFREPERLRPKRTRNQITAEAAGQFAELAYTLRGEGHDPLEVAHFLNRLLFCMFAEDAGLLKSDLFTGIAEQGVEHPDHFDQIVTRLFQAMQTGGPFGTDIIDWFNGGLFDNDDTLPVTLAQIRTIRDLARMDWSQIEPAIFGTLFERGLDPAKRSQLGAHYTDPDSIMRLVNPTIVEPLMEEWRATRAEISKQMEHMERVKTKAATRKRRKAAEDAFFGFLEKLRNFRVLDPACGSGNFLYLSLQALKRIEHRANIEAEALGLARQAPMVGPEAVMGIELNAYAAELARVTVWIGEIQWMLDHGYSLSKDPILKSLDTIEQRDAILNEDGTEPDWPPADLIVGNPPFLGNKKMLAELGESYVRSLRALYTAGMPGGVDLVTYWYEKARAQLVAGLVERVGLVATNSIRGGANRSVVDSICRDAEIFDSWSDEPWVNEGAAVRVSLICFGMPIAGRQKHLNGDTVGAIYADLTGDTHGATDLTLARVLPENSGVAFIGGMKKGPFDVPGETARKWLLSGGNPNGRPNSDVVRPWLNGMDVTRRPSDTWIVDFSEGTVEADAALYEAPFIHVQDVVKPMKSKVRNRRERENWWIHARTAPDLRKATTNLSRFIATPRVAKHRLFVWITGSVVIDGQLVVIARDDDTTFGVLHSRAHELWALRMGTSLEDRPRYTPTTTFETFPFPDGLTPDSVPAEFANGHADSIAEASKKLVQLRDTWLNPSEWTDRISEVVPGYPDRVVPKKGHEDDLKKRTLTNLYNQRPPWLDNAHHELDEVVAAAYGWPAGLSDDQILANLLELNLGRATAE